MKKIISLVLFSSLAALIIFSVLRLETDIEDDTIYTESTVEESYREETLTEEVTVDETVDNNKTGTLDNIKFIVDVTSILQHTDNTFLIIGNTATEKYYSGEIHIVCNSVEDLIINETFTFIVEPLMSMSKPTVVTAVTYNKSDIEDINELHKCREIVSTYKENLLLYKNMELLDIIKHSNDNYYTWTNAEIEQFIGYITDLGYDDTFQLKSEVKIISAPNYSDAYF